LEEAPTAELDAEAVDVPRRASTRFVTSLAVECASTNRFVSESSSTTGV
jgi:hypothetical protein